MRFEDLSPDQLAALHRQVLPVARYIARLHARMVEQQFPEGDPLFCHVDIAHSALQQIRRQAWKGRMRLVNESPRERFLRQTGSQRDR